MVINNIISLTHNITDCQSSQKVGLGRERLADPAWNQLADLNHSIDHVKIFIIIQVSECKTIMLHAHVKWAGLIRFEIQKLLVNCFLHLWRSKRIWRKWNLVNPTTHNLLSTGRCLRPTLRLHLMLSWLDSNPSRLPSWTCIYYNIIYYDIVWLYFNTILPLYIWLYTQV